MSGPMLNYAKTCNTSMQRFRESGTLVDVILVLPDKSRLPCHKLILMMACPFFEDMFNSGFKEATSKEVKVAFAKSEIIRSVIDFFYTRELELSEDTIKHYVAASSFLCCEDLKAYCEEYLVNCVDGSNCMDLKRFGELFSLEVLVKESCDYILRNFQTYGKIVDFTTLREEELIWLLKNNDLRAENEDVVFDAVVDWVKADDDDNATSRREEAFPRLVALIRFVFCTRLALANRIVSNDLMKKYSCIDLVHEALWSQYHFNCRTLQESEKCTARVLYKLPLFLVANRRRPETFEHYLTTFVYEDCEWREIGRTIETGYTTRIHSASGVHLVNKDKCWFWHNDGRNVTEFSWDGSLDGAWEKKKQGSFLYVDGKVLAFGGNNTCPVKSIRSFDFTNPKAEWKYEGEMLHEFEVPRVVQLGNKIHVFDRYHHDEFDTTTKTWRERGKLPFTNSAFELSHYGSVAVLEKKIYLIGGRERVGCFRYDPTTDQWRSLTSPQYTYYAHSAVVWNGKLLLGGRSTDSFRDLRMFEEYDPISDTWHERDRMFHPQFKHAAYDGDFFLYSQPV